MNDKTQSDPSSSSKSLVSRLDHLDFLMKYLERKQNLAKLEGNINGSSSAGGELKMKQCMPVDTALKETHFKGSLMDRVAALENRLFQLCLEKESSSSSSTSTQASSGETYWSYRSKGESSCSLPTFTSNIPSHLHSNRLPRIHATKPEIQEQPDIENDAKQKKSSSSSPAQQNHRKKKKKTKTTRANKEENSLKPEKKRISFINWPHLKLLGC